MRLELVETQRYAVLSRRATRQRWFGRSVAAFTGYKTRVSYGDPALRALMEPHLRKMRAARPTTDSSMTARILRYDADRYKLAEALRGALDLPSLEWIACADAHAKRALLAPLLDPSTRRPFQRAYDAWVRGVVLPAPVWKSKVHGAFVLNHRVSSTPSTRRLLDGVAMPVPRRSTEPGRPRHRREMT